MTIEITESLLADIEAKAKAATPGPWGGHPVDDTSIVAADKTDVATTCDSSQAERDDGYNIEYERMEADALHIRRMDPPTTLALISAHRAALARIAGMEAENAALEDRCIRAEGNEKITASFLKEADRQRDEARRAALEEAEQAIFRCDDEFEAAAAIRSLMDKEPGQ